MFRVWVGMFMIQPSTVKTHTHHLSLLVYQQQTHTHSLSLYLSITLHASLSLPLSFFLSLNSKLSSNLGNIKVCFDEVNWQYRFNCWPWRADPSALSMQTPLAHAHTQSLALRPKVFLFFFIYRECADSPPELSVQYWWVYRGIPDWCP